MHLGAHSRVQSFEKLETNRGLYKPADPTLDAMACGSGFDRRGSDSLTSGRDQRDRSMVGVIKRLTVSTGQLRAFLPLHLPPINRVVYPGSLGLAATHV